LNELARSSCRPKQTEIVFAGLVDEEDAQAGSRILAASGFKADLAIVGEATRLKVVTAHKGISWFRLETRGRSAHGSRPELGQNAVHTMARVVDVLETEYARELESRLHPVLRRPTVNVGTISGGVQANIVPDRCEISIDRRTLPGETDFSVLREITALLRRHNLKVWSVPVKGTPCPAMETDASLPLVAQMMRSIGQRKPAGVDYFCDAAVLAEAGIPSVVFGPGDIAHAHIDHEWVSLTSLERATAMLQRFLQSLP
jgi:acetylornithine deacetylase/succinyl-diaminopimelate desuccinylase-like protein